MPLSRATVSPPAVVSSTPLNFACHLATPPLWAQSAAKVAEPSAASVSGQVLVYQDVLGLNPGFKPKFLRAYANTFGVIQAALNAYDRDVKDGGFPAESESYELHPANLHIAKHAA